MYASDRKAELAAAEPPKIKRPRNPPGPAPPGPDPTMIVSRFGRYLSQTAHDHEVRSFFATESSSTGTGSCPPGPGCGSGRPHHRRRPGGSLGPLGSAEPVDLDGRTLLPGFIDAHAHPVFAGHQLRHCDLSAASTEPEYLEMIARYARAHPDEEWITGGGWSHVRLPGGHAGPAVARRRGAATARCSCRTATTTAPGSTAGRWTWPGSTRAPPTRRTAGSSATPAAPDRHAARGRDGPGRPAAPEATDDDNYAALLAAQAYLLSLGITGWQDAIIGQMPGAIDPLAPTCGRPAPGPLRADVVGALWWDRDRGSSRCRSC